MAEIWNHLSECAAHIRQGELVAFPTETVYGLGANALDPEAIQKIFSAKKRPLTDPVIVHVTSTASALSLLAEDDSLLLGTYKFLAEQFWPGPLTLICRGNAKVSPLLTANTGCVGIRWPNHTVAIALIEAAGVPIAAPSANLFSHVSPTTAQHVLDDFLDSEYSIKVLDGGRTSFGIESTVLKLCLCEGGLCGVILRKGGVPEEALVRALEGRKVEILTKEQFLDETVSAEAPGQLVQHYAPYIETLVVVEGEPRDFLYSLQESVAIDYHGGFGTVEFLAKRDLSETGSVTEAVNNLYELLRWSEKEHAKCVLLPDLRGLRGEHAAALLDRVFRASAGKTVCLQQNGVYTVN